MNKTINIISVIFYILFTQVYPVVHWHAHDDQNEIELHVVVHPPDFPTDGAGHKDHHEHSGAHDQHMSHFDGDWNYTDQSKPAKIQISKYFYSHSEHLNLEIQIIKSNNDEESNTLSSFNYLSRHSNRAPPLFS